MSARRAAGAAPALDEAVAWHDVECAAYDADLPLWRELAGAAGGPVLDLGCGTGRVALDLAARGHEVTGVDSEPALVAALAARARERGLRASAVVADIRSLSLGRRFALAVAPMQVAQLLGGAAGRAAMLAAVRRHLEPGAVLAPALADPFAGLPAAESLPPAPDVLERGGWVLQSRPVAVREEAPAGGGRAAAIDRLREAVSPEGALERSLATVVLELLDPAELERQAERSGFRVLGRRAVPETEGYVGSAVPLLEAA